MLSFPIKTHMQKSWQLRGGGIESKNFSLKERLWLCGISQPWPPSSQRKYREMPKGQSQSSNLVLEYVAQLAPGILQEGAERLSSAMSSHLEI